MRSKRQNDALSVILIVLTMIIPHRELSPEALAGVIQEYVTRDGTELSEADAKAAKVRELLERGELLIVFDADSESCNIVARDQLPPVEDVRVEDD